VQNVLITVVFDLSESAVLLRYKLLRASVLADGGIENGPENILSEWVDGSVGTAEDTANVITC